MQRGDKMRYARLENSARLQRTLKALESGGWKSTRDLIRKANICAVNSCISELRANGFDISTRCLGKGRYEYKLEGKA